MDVGNRIVALIVAAGKGERAGGCTPKQFAPLAGRAVLAHSIAAFERHPAIDEIVIVIAPEQEAEARAAVGDRFFVTGGATRRASVRNGLDAIGSAARVLIHDAARPLLPATVIDRLLDALDDHAGAIPALPVADTLARMDGALGETVSRDGLIRVQTPQAFRFADVVAAHRDWPDDREATDDAQIVRAAGHSVAVVQGDAVLEKITHPADFAAAETRLSARTSVRTGLGYDVHRLVDGEELWLGGILIPHSQGLSGHSDADVALHALTDALLGTIAAGDIGQHFPPSDPQWRGASSDRFLCHAADLIDRSGGTISHVDLTIICEAPKIGPYRDAMRARIADLLRVDLARVSVKATTTERLGFTGRGEGIAAQAVATIALGDL